VANRDTDTITEYAPGAHDDASPIAVIGGPETALTAVDGITVDAYGNIVVGAGEGYLDVFAPGSDGNIAPSYEIGGGATGIEFAVGLVADGRDLYVLSRSQTGTSVIDLPADARGNAVPRGTIAGAETRLLNGGGIALDAAGNVYVTNEDMINNRSWVSTFAPGTTGDAAPAEVLQGNHAGLGAPTGIAVGAPLYATTTNLPPASVGTPYLQTLGAALGLAPYHWTRVLGSLPAGLRLTPRGVISGTPKQPGVATVDVEVRDAAQHSTVVTLTIDVGVPPLVYVANSTFGHSSVIAFKPGETGDSAPFIDISGPDTGLDQPQGIAFDSVGNLYVANYGGTITEYAPDANGDAAPIRTIGGAHTGLLSPTALALDSFGNLFVANGLGNDVLEFAPGAQDDASPTATITGISNPVAIAFDPQGRLWVSSVDTIEAIEIVNGPVNAYATLGGAHTGLDGVKGFAFDADGWLHVSNLNAGTETLYRPGSIGDTPPVQSVSVQLPWGVAADATGRVTVAGNAAPYTITSFGRFGSSPSSVAGPSTGLAQPTGVAITPQ
jgi:Putative Ig domain